MFDIKENECYAKIFSKEDHIQIYLNIITSGDYVLIESTEKKFEINVAEAIDKENNHNGLFYAAMIKNHEEYLLSKGVDPFLRDIREQNCLYFFAREKNIPVAQILIEEYNVELNKVDVFGQTSFFYAAREGSIEMCTYLESQGAEVNLIDKNGQNALFYAIQKRNYNTVKYLIDLGLDINLKDKKGQTPISVAREMKEMAILKLIQRRGGISSEPYKDRVESLKEKKPKKRIYRNFNFIQKKREREKQKEKEEMSQFSKDELIETIQRTKQYTLVKINEKGEKIPLTQADITSLKVNFPDVSKLLDDKTALIKAVSEQNEDLLINESWEKTAKELMKLLWRFPDSSIFHVRTYTPLNMPKELDFILIKKKLKSLQYTNFKQFCVDMNNIFETCFQTYGESSKESQMCQNVRNEFKRLFIQLNMEKYL